MPNPCTDLDIRRELQIPHNLYPNNHLFCVFHVLVGDLVGDDLFGCRLNCLQVR